MSLICVIALLSSTRLRWTQNSNSHAIQRFALGHKRHKSTGCCVNNNNMGSAMRKELWRLLSFKDSTQEPNQEASAILLAQDGFYFDRESGQILCFSCGNNYAGQTASTSLQFAHNQGCRRVDLDQPMNRGTRDFSQGLATQYVSQDSSSLQDEQCCLSGAKNIDENGFRKNGVGHDSVNGTDPAHSNNLPSEDQRLSNSINLPSEDQRLPNSINLPSEDQQQPHSINLPSEDRQLPEPINLPSENELLPQPINLPSENERLAQPINLPSENELLPQPINLPSENERLAQPINLPSENERLAQPINLPSEYQRLPQSINLPSENQRLPHDNNLPNSHLSQSVIRNLSSTSGRYDQSNGTSVERIPVSTHPSLDLSLVSYPQFSQMQVRIATFRGRWPTHLHLPEYLAGAGFFHAGKSDRVCCFCCGLELQIGNANKVITTTHARLRPDCAYSQLLGGQGRQTQQHVVRHTTGENSPASTTVAGATSTGEEHVKGGVYDSGCELSYPMPATVNPKPISASRDLAEDLRVVEREHALLEDQTTCRICRSKTISCIFLPCGHVVACQDCADKSKNCILCGKLIVGTANVFLA